jgi:hypothetical protein
MMEWTNNIKVIKEHKKGGEGWRYKRNGFPWETKRACDANLILYLPQVTIIILQFIIQY